MKRIVFLAAVCAAFVAVAFDTPFEHVQYESLSLDGAWEMAYCPYEWQTVDLPKFAGVRVAEAVPNYWEDMEPALRAAGMTDAFRRNPLYELQTLPIDGYANDTTLPNIYGCFFYRRTFRLERVAPAVLAFEGVRNQVHAWVNGRFVAFRAGFSTPFELALPSDVLRVGENEIVLAVSNNPNLGYCGAYVCGLTTRAIFGATGGVNGHLALHLLKGKLADVYVTTAHDLASFTVHVAGGEAFAYAIRAGNRVVSSGHASGDFTLPTRGYAFWSPENPVRYTLELTTAAGTYRTLFGLRRLVPEGEKLRLNGEPVYLRGVTEHCYFPLTVHLPRDLDYYRMITRKRKELGFNFVRFHTFVPPVEYLEATDELGMLVHVETPNFVSEPEFAAIIAFARRHPSVVIYCMGNEWRVDRLAEAYLKDCADMVHAETDALFSPMSALRGLEYSLVKGKDVIVKSPFAHNPERIARVASFSDLFTSYQLGAVSYFSIGNTTARDLDVWGDCYCGKPRTSHEICIDGSYADLSLEKLYPADSPILKTGLFSEVRKEIAAHGLLDRAEIYFRHSCEWMRRVRKYTFEKLRLSDRTAGFDFLGDINTHWHTFGYSVGMMDEFYRLKPGESVANVLRYNSPAVLLADFDTKFNVYAGETKRVTFKLSNYACAAPSAKLSVELVEAASGRVVFACAREVGALANGTLATLGAVDVRVPPAEAPRKYLVRAACAGGALKVANEWEVYAFPRLTATADPSGLRVVSDISESDLQAALAHGERVVLLGAGPFKTFPMSFRIGMAGRAMGNYATVIQKGHPALAGFPHEGFCGWQFAPLMKDGRVVQLEAGVPFDPIVDVASSVKHVVRQAALFEYAVGKGRLLVSSFNLSADDPAAATLRKALLDYAASEAFAPRLTLTPEQLHAVIAAPRVTDAADRNRARNPNDPSSAVRAGALAQP